VRTLPDFSVPEDVYRWPMSCHHGRALERAEHFLAVPPAWGLQLFYVMGHSYEFDRDGWEMIERFCAMLGGRDDIWYATNLEIADYLAARRRLCLSADGGLLYNPSAVPVWYSLWEALPVATGVVPPGETVRVGVTTRSYA